MLKKILVGLLAVVALFLGYVAMQPAVGVVTRSATIPAPPEAIFPHLNNLKKWNEWSPWAKLDPNSKVAYEGPEEGVGAAFSWDGNYEVGKGKLSVVESAPGDHVKYRLDFEKPMPGTSDVDITLKPEGTGTNVTWTMTGERPFFARVICTLVGADRMAGGMFEKGLANLASAVASQPG